MSRLLSGFIVLFVLILAAPAAMAAQKWDKASFEAAQAAGSSILVHVTAPWCPTCRAQQPTIEDIEATHPTLKLFAVDFDSQKDALRYFRVLAQSTLITYRGKAEVARSTGITDRTAIMEMVDQIGR
jgi:thioredoxin 1